MSWKEYIYCNTITIAGMSATYGSHVATSAVLQFCALKFQVTLASDHAHATGSLVALSSPNTMIYSYQLPYNYSRCPDIS